MLRSAVTDSRAQCSEYPTYKEKQMAIGTMQGSLYYDANRDMYYSQRDMYEREMHQRQMYAAQQQMNHSPYAGQQQQMVEHTRQKDPKDPLSFLSKADNKILLTGEAT
jgi:hypothetical protein